MSLAGSQEKGSEHNLGGSPSPPLALRRAQAFFKGASVTPADVPLSPTRLCAPHPLCSSPLSPPSDPRVIV